MNDGLVRDLHDAQMEELKTITTKIDELVAQPTVSTTDIAKIQMMISNIEIPAQDFTELKVYIRDRIAQNASASQVAEVDKLIRACNNNLVDIYDSIDKRLCELVLQQQGNTTPKNIIHKIDFSSRKVIFGVLSSVVIAIGVTFWAFNLSSENEKLRTNDLKYRYIKMVGDIDDRLVYDLEELIYKDKSGKVLNEMETQIEDYERTIELKIRAEEQARLNREESAKLDKQIKELQKK